MREHEHAHCVRGECEVDGDIDEIDIDAEFRGVVSPHEGHQCSLIVIVVFFVAPMPLTAQSKLNAYERVIVFVVLWWYLRFQFHH